MRLLLKIVVGTLVILALLAVAFFSFGQRLLVDRLTKQYMKRQIIEQSSTKFEAQKRPLNFAAFAAETLDETIISELDTFLSTATIPEIQNRFEDGSLSVELLLLYYIKRIEAFDENKINSVLELNPDALEIATALDAELEAERNAGTVPKVRSPMHGIPILLKDNIATGDKLHTTAGALAMKDARGDQDAFIVQQLREAGAIVLGKANLSEWSNFMSNDSVNGYSALGGHTRNPYGRFDVGGSSSGPAAAAAANFATVTIGTETAGSLIYPAGQNSVVALKPSLGLVSRDRIIPISEAQDSAGPIGRSVSDVALLLTVIAAQDSQDPQASNAAALANTNFADFLKIDGLAGKRIGFYNGGKLDTELNTELKMFILNAFKEADAELIELNWQVPIINYVAVLKYGIKNDLQHYFDTVGNVSPMRSLEDVIAFNSENLETAAAYGQSLLEQGQAQTLEKADYEMQVSRNQEKGANAIREQLKKHNLDAILSVSNELSGVYAPAGFPAIILPAGYKENGEPVGITLVGDYLSDAELIAMAFAFEQMMPVRTAPELSDWYLE